jgi:SAM-dependent methyltransferase
MRDIVLFNENFKKIDDEYFSNYGGKNYSENYFKFTTPPEQVIQELVWNDIQFKKLLDVGCASGELVRDFRRLGIDAYGIENNKEILKNNVSSKYCKYGDMRDLSSIKDSSFDVIYTNCLMYAFPTEVVGILNEFNRIAKKAVYLCCPYLENAQYLSKTPYANDPYRVFLAKSSWWDKQFKEANFKKLDKNIYAV